MKRLFRYRTISVWLILGYAIAFLMFNFRAQSNIILESEKEALKESVHNYIYTMRIEITDKNIDVDVEAYIKEFLEELCQEGLMVEISDLYLEHKPGLSYIESADICVSDNLPKYPLYKGTYPTKKQLEQGGGYAVVGYSRKDDVYIRNGKEYLDFNNEAFQVTGYLSKDSEWLVQNATLLFCNFDTEGAWRCIARYLEDGYLYIDIESDEISNLSEWFDYYNERAKAISRGSFCVKYINDVHYQIIGEVREMYSKAPTDIAKSYALYIFLFVVVMLCFMVEFWMLQRKKEFIIIREFGFSIFDIIVRFYKELLAMAIMGVVAGEFISLIFNYISNGYLEFKMDNTYYNFVIIVEFIFTTVILSSAFSVIKLITKNIRKNSSIYSWRN